MKRGIDQPPLRRLADIAKRVTPNGQLPAADLSKAAQACLALAPSLYNASAASTAFDALKEPSTRAGLVKLLACAVRNIANRRAWACQNAKWREWHRLYLLTSRVLIVFIGQQPAVPATNRCIVEQATVQMLVEADLLPGFCSVLASSAGELSRGEGSSSPDEDLVYAYDTRSVVAYTMHVVFSLVRFAGYLTAASVREDRYNLLRAVARSHVLEHLVRAVLLQLWRTAGTRYEAETARELEAPVHLLWANLRMLTLYRVADDPRVARLAEQLLAGPCMQHFMLLHVVAQLGAADGGPSYGLPPTAGLPVIYVNGANKLFPVPAEAVAAAGGSAARTPAHPLATEGLIHAVDFWLRCIAMEPKLPLPPIPGRALRVLCVRLADAANGALEAARANPGSGAGGGASANSSATARPVLVHGQCVHLAQRALLCGVSSAVAAPRRVEAMAGLWRAVIRTVDNSIAEGYVRGWEDASLLELLRPRFAGELRPVSPLPLSPTHDIVTALSAGYVGRLERLLRLGYAATDGSSLASALPEILEHFKTFNRMSNLWAYGAPAEVAALTTTAAKILRRFASSLAAASPAVQASLLQALSAGLADLDIASGLLEWLCSFSKSLHRTGRPGEYSSWWLKASGSGGSSAAVAQDKSTAAASDDGGGCSGGGGGSSGAGPHSSDPRGQPAPLFDLCTQATFALSRWLPAMAHCAAVCRELVFEGGKSGSAAVAGAQPRLNRDAFTAAFALETIVLGCMPAIGVAYMAAAGTEFGPTAPGLPSQPDSAASWRQLLLQEVDVFGLVHAHVELLARCWERLDGMERRVHLVASTLPFLAMAFPSMVRGAFVAPIAAAGPFSGSSVLQAVEDMLGPLSRVGYGPSLELVRQVCDGRFPDSEFHKALSDLLPDFKWTVESGHLLPPPCVAAARIGLRLCGNAKCTSLVGDNEGALVLSRCGGSCGGAVAYCCRDCQRADWKAGHQKVCGPSGPKAGSKVSGGKG